MKEGNLSAFRVNLKNPVIAWISADEREILQIISSFWFLVCVFVCFDLSHYSAMKWGRRISGIKMIISF